MPEVELEKRHLKPGQAVFTEGEIGQEAFLLESGLLEVAKRKGEAELVVATLDPGALFGEMALLDAEPRMATIRAQRPSTVVVIPKRAFDLLLKQSNPVIRAVLGTLMTRLRDLGAKSTERTL